MRYERSPVLLEKFLVEILILCSLGLFGNHAFNGKICVYNVINSEVLWDILVYIRNLVNNVYKLFVNFLFENKTDISKY